MRNMKDCGERILAYVYRLVIVENLPRRLTMSLMPGYFLSRNERVAFWILFLSFI